VVRYSEKSNPSFDWYKKTRKPEVPKNQKTKSTKKPGNQNQYQKYQSRFQQTQFQGVKFGFSEI
jgi:hypothetical protein